MKNDSLILLLSAALFFPLLMIPGYLLVSEDYYIGVFVLCFSVGQSSFRNIRRNKKKQDKSNYSAFGYQHCLFNIQYRHIYDICRSFHRRNSNVNTVNDRVCTVFSSFSVSSLRQRIRS